MNHILKEVFYTIYERILKEHQRLQQQINTIQERLNQFPSGKLICSHSGPYCKWYQKDGHNKIYISKKNRHLAEQLAAKKYLLLELKDLSHEKKALEYYLNHHSPDTGKAEQLLTNYPGYNELLSPFFTPASQKLFHWMNSSYEHNLNFPELQLYTSHGIVPTINLITTYETRDHPLTSEIIEITIEHYFL